jgi:hypothetical protein
MNTFNYPQNLYDIVNEVRLSSQDSISTHYATILQNILKKYHMWPAMQVKKFYNNNSLVLLHNSYNYNQDDVIGFKQIFDDCRSIVLDLNTDSKEKVVVSYANNIPTRISIQDYAKNIHETDKYQQAFDGTMITVYNYDDTWHFGTTSCPDVNHSSFYHPTKTHGEMLNEVLMRLFANNFTDEEIHSHDKKDIENKLRTIFTSHLDKQYAYEFVLVHHENKHIIDYSKLLGEGYMSLCHINSKDRATLEDINIHNQPLSSIGIVYPMNYTNINDAYNDMVSSEFSYGFIVAKYPDTGKKLYKISPDSITFKEETDPCKPNIWHNILSVYMKNRKDFTIKDYINMYVPDIILPIDEQGRTMDPTYLVHTMIATLKDVLYNLYVATTTYNPKTNRFKMNKELDSQFPPVIRFHLAQLRLKQQSDQYNHFLRPKDVYQYICKNNNIKNIKLLVNLLATNGGYNISERASVCITVLNNVL